ncbi:P-loop containing nucleoside triphosphate hydrolase protein [Flammula alnicola]|nr:P-loop containing nucleoside triphosphate hydrolase protein [Flammula alnicola]
MRYGQSSVAQRPDSKAISIRDLPDNQEIETSSWAGSTSATAKASMTITLVVDDSDVTVAVMGATGSGKTTFINLASGSNLRIGRGLQSCTSIVQVAQPFELEGRSVTLIDTPGFDDTTKSDSDILRMIAAFLATAYENGKKLAGVIYIHRISDFRMGGISTRNFKMFRQLCGESTLKNVVIVTNMWGEVSPELGEAREAELASQDMFFKPVLDKGALLLRHENTRDSTHGILKYIIQNHPLSLQIQRELVDQKKDISQTAAGEELNRELMEQIQKHRNEMRMLQEEMKEAIRTKDEETKRELEVETRKLQTEMNRVQTDAQKLASEYNEEKGRLERRMQELSEAARQESERATAEYNRQLSALREQLDRTSSDSAAERSNLLRQMDELRRRSHRGGGGFFAMVGRAIDGIFGI